MKQDVKTRVLDDIDRVLAIRPGYGGSGAVIEVVTAYKACILRWTAKHATHRQMAEAIKIGAPWSKLEQHARGLLNAFRRDVEAGQVALVEPSASDTEKTKMTTTRIFISHSSTDAELASSLIAFLEAGLTIPPDAIRCTSVDGYKLEGGDDGPEVLRDNLRSSDVVVGVLTTASVTSSYVLMELGAAWMAKKKAIPLIGPGATFRDLPGPFKDLHALRMDQKPDMSGLIATVARATGFAETNNLPRITASLQKLAEAVAAPEPSVGRAVLPAPEVSPAPTVGEDEALSLVRNWLRSRPAKSANLTYEGVNQELPLAVDPGVLRRVLPTAAQGTNWQVAAHEHSVALTFKAPGPTVISSPRRGW